MGDAPPSSQPDATDADGHPGVSFGEYMLEHLTRNAATSSIPSMIDYETGLEVTFKELRHQSVQAAYGLRELGLRVGDTLAFFVRNKPDIFPVLVGAIMEGITVALVIPSSTKEEARHFFSLVSPRAVLSEAGYNSAVAAAAAGPDVTQLLVGGVDGEGKGVSVRQLLQLGSRADPQAYRPPPILDLRSHIASVSFTSGTSGLPKAAALSNYAFLGSCMGRKELRTVLSPKYRILITSWLSWISGVYMNLLSIMEGITRVVGNYTTEPEIAKIIEKYKVNTWFIASPRLKLLADWLPTANPRPDVSSFTCVLSGGVALSGPTQERMIRNLGVPVAQGYAITESGILTMDGLPPRCGSSGKVVKGRTIRIVDVDTGKDITEPGVVGEIRAKSPNMMTMYIGNPEATAKAFDEQGFYCSGDLGYRDPDGHLFVVDRMKELIKYYAKEMAPAEIEETLMSHPAVQEACVVGQPDPDAGDLPTAFVSLLPGSSATEQELQQLVADRLSDFKQLRGGVHFEPKLKHTSNGKVDRTAYKLIVKKRAGNRAMPI